ncbi:MAG: sensor histidine kinase [Rhodococcus sp.]|nr:sensor histidine kinase [Rhodococcus sp. (in: high G+C Gram-positive bacteria)]
MRRFSLWLRGKPLVADAMLAALLFTSEVAVFVSVGNWGQLLLGVLICAPIIWRRKYPIAVATALVVLSLISTSLAVATDDLTLAEHPALLGLAVMLYTLVAYVGRRAGLIYLGVLILDSVPSLWLVEPEPALTVVFVAMVYALSWLAAEFVGARRAYDAEVAARLAVADYDRERRAEEAVAAERTRIARELHDVVAHAVSVMVVQADGASYVLASNPAAAQKALSNISATGRQALAELRRTVSLLRTDPALDALPQHGSAGLAHVAEMMRDAGLRVDLELSGELDDIAPAVSLGIHRVVQESLTNVSRHAGQQPRAWVQVRCTGTVVDITITDNGHGAGYFALGSGNGLVGMRERVAVLDGTLTAGPQPDGSWRVHVQLPLGRLATEEVPEKTPTSEVSTPETLAEESRQDKVPGE